MKSSAGFVDAHSHLRATPLSDFGVTGSCLEEAILRMNAMTSVNQEDDAFLACSDLIMSGITGVQYLFHTFGSPDEFLVLLDKALAGIRRSKIRAQVILTITDQYEFVPPEIKGSINLPSFVNTGRKMLPNEFVELFATAQKAHSDFDFGVGPVAPQWCSDSMMEAINEISQPGLRVHTHCLESERARTWITESPIVRLQRFGLLGRNTSLAHSIWLSDEEINLVEQTGTKLVTCPRSNLFLKSGKADCATWSEAGIDFGIGLDSIGYPESPLATAKLALAENDALNALTIGGGLAAGLNTEADKVVWRDWDQGIVESLHINGFNLIRDGVHIYQDEIEETRNRIKSLVNSDYKTRQLRHSSLDEIMENYLAAVL